MLDYDTIAFIEGITNNLFELLCNGNRIWVDNTHGFLNKMMEVRKHHDRRDGLIASKYEIRKIFDKNEIQKYRKKYASCTKGWIFIAGEAEI